MSSQENFEKIKTRKPTDEQLRKLFGIVDGDGATDELPRTEASVKTSIEPYTGDPTSYSIFKETFHPDLNEIYYPASGTDVTPSVAFPNAKIIYAEIEPKIVAALQAAHYDAVAADVSNFRLETLADAVIVMSPGGIKLEAFDVFLGNIKAGGYILCNNWPGPGAAEVFSKKQGVKPLGMIKYDAEAGKEVFVSTQHFEESGLFVFQKL